jgi:predicted enzyme related to lactoylglutathione lyase
MTNRSQLRGFATISLWADDVAAAVTWYKDLLGVDPYFVRPQQGTPEYVEFRLGDYQHELGIISRRHQAPGTPAGPAGVVAYWHVDDIEATLRKLKDMGAKEHQPLIKREAGFVTASVVDPFGNILGIMFNPHYLEVLASMTGRREGQTTPNSTSHGRSTM